MTVTKIVASEIERLVFTVSGPDAGKYLHSQLSNDVASLLVGQSRYSFVLEPMGKVIALVRVTRVSEEVFVLDTDAVEGLSDQLLERLNRFKIRVKAEIVVSTEKYLCIRSTDGSSLEVEGGIPAQWGNGLAVDTPLGTVDLGHPESIEQVTGEVLEALRIRAGWPMMGREIISGETLPAATGVVSRAVSFTKGCYPGQELVERMDSRGSTAPKTLRLLRGDSILGAVAGGAIIVDGVEVGVFTSVGEGDALGYVARAADIGILVGSANDSVE